MLDCVELGCIGLSCAGFCVVLCCVVLGDWVVAGGYCFHHNGQEDFSKKIYLVGT